MKLQEKSTLTIKAAFVIWMLIVLVNFRFQMWGLLKPLSRRHRIKVNLQNSHRMNFRNLFVQEKKIVWTLTHV